MEMAKIFGVGMIGTLLCIVLQKQNPQFAIVTAFLTGILILSWIFTPLSNLLHQLRDMAAQAGVEDRYFAIILKVIGIAYLAQFGAQLCTDAGEGAVAAKIELAGKVLIMAVSAPILAELLQVIVTLV